MEGWGGPRDVRRVITESRQSYLDRTAAANAPDPVTTS